MASTVLCSVLQHLHFPLGGVQLAPRLILRKSDQLRRLRESVLLHLELLLSRCEVQFSPPGGAEMVVSCGFCPLKTKKKRCLSSSAWCCRRCLLSSCWYSSRRSSARLLAWTSTSIWASKWRSHVSKPIFILRVPYITLIQTFHA